MAEPSEEYTELNQTLTKLYSDLSKAKALAMKLEEEWKGVLIGW